MTREDLEVTRWRGFSHAELYAQLHNGPGASASAVPAKRWAELATTLHDINIDLTKAISDAKTSWAGSSADLAFTQLGDVATWAGDVGESAAKMRTSVEQQADHIGRARANMPAPSEQPTTQPDPLLSPVTQIIDMQKDLEPLERAASDAARRAHEVMQLYQNDTTGTTDTLATFVEPVDTNGVDAHHTAQRGGILGFVEQTTQVATAAVGLTPMTPSPEITLPITRGGGQLVSQAGAEFFLVDTREPAVRQAPAPLQQGSMAGADPLGAPQVAATPQRDQSARRTPGRVPSATPFSLGPDPIPGAAPATASSAVTPTTAAGVGGSADRAMPRRVGESLIPTQWTENAAEPANQAKRRRDRTAEEEKITHSVDGAEAEVPPPVIGTESYRQ